MKKILQSLLLDLFTALLTEAMELISQAIKDGRLNQLIDTIDNPTLKALVIVLVRLMGDLLNEVRDDIDMESVSLQIRNMSYSTTV